MPGKLKGTIVEVSNRGDLISDLGAEDLAGIPRDHSVSIKCGGHVTAGIHPVDHDQPELTFLALVNENERLVLSLVGDSASQFLGIRVGEPLVISW